ncbi:alpha/beta fold hydrolase [Streptomyces lasiicapitis]|uniref:Alpha/beta hydrolase n=1 Tax=Streptomyces lasiicapitis TaxID=1923961 RepID=A0ABQ2M1F5_9ACTN|nr:alpha/beta fold hydrolase [Streptomyces lasiicapitis]GGO45646.1 alpha/beta hydrolase [Streptomyces lasiicapitis]
MYHRDRSPCSALAVSRSVERPRAAVLLLHGGHEYGTSAPGAWNLPAARMVPFERAVRRATKEHDVLIGRVRYRCRGWNGGRADAAHDAERALHELARVAGDVPTVLVGHSMGARAALRAAGGAHVRGVVGLAPWCPPEDSVRHLDGRHVVLLHGDRDRVTDPKASADFLARARAAGADASFVEMRGSGHAMLRRSAAWHELTTSAVTGLLGLTPLSSPFTGEGRLLSGA